MCDDNKSTRSNSAVSSFSTKSRRSFLAKWFLNDEAANTKKPRTKQELRDALLAQLDHHASYDKDVKEKNGGGLAGAKGLGH
jgi:hypothetical protein